MDIVQYLLDDCMSLEGTIALGCRLISKGATILPAKSNSDFTFVYNFIRDLQSIDHLCINPIFRIGLIHK